MTLKSLLITTRNMNHTPKCPYCGKVAELVGGDVIYPHRPDLSSKRFYSCESCKAYVGTHYKTGEPFGTLANAQLREMRKRAHASFDPIWKGETRRVSRTTAYNWLRGKMGLRREDCHIGMFTEKQCLRVIEVCEERKATWTRGKK